MAPANDKTLASEFVHIYEVICQPQFLNMEALGGEVPFFISTYEPEKSHDRQLNHSK